MDKMREIRAMGVSGGMGAGRAYILEKKQFLISHEPSADPVAELRRFDTSLEKVIGNTKKLLDTTRKEETGSTADILDAYVMLLEDPETTNQVRALIGRSYNAPLAVKEALGGIISMFEALDDAYMRERAYDIKDIMNILLQELLGANEQDISSIPPGSVIIADDLATSDTVKMDMDNIAGIITAMGGQNSHTSIVARSFEIPAIVGAGQMIDLVCPGDEILMDGDTGHAYIRPTNAVSEGFFRRREKFEKDHELLMRFSDCSGVTRDGRRIEIQANISTPGELRRVLDSAADGIGLFRSEFLYMDKKESPAEQLQFDAYKSIVSVMNGKPVTIRTMDIGGDKHLDYLNFEKEDNPFLGYRAIRVSLDRKDLFRTQLRAILRASSSGSVRLLLPFISSVQELTAAKDELELAKAELRQENVNFDESIPVGVMIELPSAVIMARELAAACDFFTIGTNDLIQYTVGVDRGNSKISNLYSQYHPAVLRLVAHTIKCAGEAGISCCMCGESAGDPLLIPALIGMGLRNFSMRTGSVLMARAVISTLDFDAVKNFAGEVLGQPTSDDVHKLLEEYAVRMYREIYGNINA